VGSALRPDARSGRRRVPLAWLALLPFFAYALGFLFIPAADTVIGAFQKQGGGATLDNVRKTLNQPYLDQYWLTIKISLITAGGGCVIGLCIAYAAIREGTPRFIRTTLTTFSGVAANFAGVPLAFAFIATLGTIGVVTGFMRDYLGFDPYQHGFTVFGETGVEITYMYFQIPLMILVIAPAIDGLRAEWREAASNLGASSWQFWRHVGIPVLLPSILGAFILLFGNSFSAYATAYGLAGNSVFLVPITIGFYLSGNVLSDPHFAQALAFGMFVVLAVMMLLYIPLQRRSARWMR
jgi:putative spermidine/putrescine transport system permease protein